MNASHILPAAAESSPRRSTTTALPGFEAAAPTSRLQPLGNPSVFIQPQQQQPRMQAPRRHSSGLFLVMQRRHMGLLTRPHDNRVGCVLSSSGGMGAAVGTVASSSPSSSGPGAAAATGHGTTAGDTGGRLSRSKSRLSHAESRDLLGVRFSPQQPMYAATRAVELFSRTRTTLSAFAPRGSSAEQPPSDKFQKLRSLDLADALGELSSDLWLTSLSDLTTYLATSLSDYATALGY